MTSELKPCPFCGGTDLKSGGDDKVVGVYCMTCQAQSPNHYGSYDWNTRAVPDVPELVNVAHMVEFEDTDLDGERFKAFHHSYLGYPNAFPVVRRDQAAAIIAADRATLEQAKKEINTLLVSYVREHFFENKTFQPLDSLIGQISQLDNAITITRDFKSRSEAAEAKNAQYEAQEPVAWMHPEARWVHMCKEEVANHCVFGISPVPLYASPAPSADLKTEMERLREVIENSGCPRPCNGRSDDTTVKECISYGECACVYGTALNPSELKND